MSKIIKGEDIGLVGEFERVPGSSYEGSFRTGDGYILLRRLPEKSELEKWLESDSVQRIDNGQREYFNTAQNDGIRIGFKKAIEVAEEADRGVNPGTLRNHDSYVTRALKKFAGVK